MEYKQEFPTITSGSNIDSGYIPSQGYKVYRLTVDASSSSIGYEPIAKNQTKYVTVVAGENKKFAYSASASGYDTFSTAYWSFSNDDSNGHFIFDYILLDVGWFNLHH
jgi:hypothetical protein